MVAQQGVISRVMGGKGKRVVGGLAGYTAIVLQFNPTVRGGFEQDKGGSAANFSPLVVDIGNEYIVVWYLCLEQR